MTLDPEPQGVDPRPAQDDRDDAGRGGAREDPYEGEDPRHAPRSDDEGWGEPTARLSVLEERDSHAGPGQLLSTMSRLMDVLSAERAEVIAAREQRFKLEIENARLQAELGAERQLRGRAEKELERLNTEMEERRRRVQAELERIAAEASRMASERQRQSQTPGASAEVPSSPAEVDATAPASSDVAGVAEPSPNPVGPPASALPPSTPVPLGGAPAPPPPRSQPQELAQPSRQLAQQVIEEATSVEERPAATELPPGWRYVDDVPADRVSWWQRWKRRR